MEEIAALDESERRKWIPVTRDLTAKEKFDAQIRLYAPCGCDRMAGSKFCMWHHKPDYLPPEMIETLTAMKPNAEVRHGAKDADPN